MILNSTSDSPLDDCLPLNLYMITAFGALRGILLLPLSILILYLGHQRWRQQRSFKTASHSDVFTYHMAVMELIWVLGCLCSICGKYTDQPVMAKVGVPVYFIAYHGEMSFHVLTCVERYLAVVHPITYLGLRNARGVRIRNISIVCVWLLCFGLMCTRDLLPPDYVSVPLFCLLGFSIIIISFCSLSVLCVLFRPGPVEGGGEKDRVDQSKLRAFHTIIAVTCAVWVWFVGVLVSEALTNSPLLSNTDSCMVVMCTMWFNLPSSLVLPLLYLHRAGKLSCFCDKNK